MNNPTIRYATVQLPAYSRLRTRKTGMGGQVLRRLFEEGADFLIHNCNGVPVDTVCSCRDFCDGAEVMIVEQTAHGYMETKSLFYYNAPREEHDIPPFMAGLPVELD